MKTCSSRLVRFVIGLLSLTIPLPPCPHFPKKKERDKFTTQAYKLWSSFKCASQTNTGMGQIPFQSVASETSHLSFPFQPPTCQECGRSSQAQVPLHFFTVSPERPELVSWSCMWSGHPAQSVQLLLLEVLCITPIVGIFFFFSKNVCPLLIGSVFSVNTHSGRKQLLDMAAV